MGYKLLGYVVWQGGKWYVRRRVDLAPRKLALAGLAGTVLVGSVVAVGQRRAASS
jgi:hypothetical protein